jgi:DNA processing protein
MSVDGAAEPAACDGCLPRLHLLGLLASYIEKVATGEAGRRSPQLLALDDEALAHAVAPRKADRLLTEAREVDAASIRRRVSTADCWAVCHHDQRFPAALRNAGDAPQVLVGRGDPAGLDRLRPETTVTLVGARRATTQGREVARELARDLAGAGFAIVSGLAWGIDGAAHEGALRAGFTAAVLGCGADVVYPLHHRKLYRQVRAQGMVLSELPPGTGAWRWAFPARNRIMAALGAMTIVIEAAGHSGSLITAELASELGREVGAVPGSITARMAAGTNQLIADGAHLVRNADDVIDALLGPGSRRPATGGPPLDPALAGVLERVDAGDADSDAVATALRLRADEVTAALTRLELLGYVTRSFSGNYSRTALAPPERDAGGTD